MGQLWDPTSQNLEEILRHSSLKFTLSLISGNWVYTMPRIDRTKTVTSIFQTRTPFGMTNDSSVGGTAARDGRGSGTNGALGALVSCPGSE